jgi:exodeoxyribonuclease VII large subunit
VPEHRQKSFVEKMSQASQPSLFDVQPQRRVWKVSELTDQISALLERAFADVWVEGEVSNCRAAPSGHIYFTLKDTDAQIRCVCFKDQLRGIKFRPEDGLHITVRGSVAVYEVRGEYQIYVTHIEPVGLGALQLAFEQLKKRLQEEGLFSEARKKPLPLLPRCIGIVTSPTGAAIRDILRVLGRRFSSAHVQLYPVKVQGDGAAREISTALRYFSEARFAEVVILARGGGSLEDLWAFNEEVVARAIAACEVPVISGVGHEIDFTIADFVADLRAPTPSAAAEIVVRSRQDFEQQIVTHARQLAQQMRYFLSERKHRVRDLETHRGFRTMEMLVRRRHQQVDEFSSALGIALRLRLAASRQQVAGVSGQIAAFDLRGRAAALRRRLDHEHAGLRAALERLVTRRHRDFVAMHLRFARTDLRSRIARFRQAVDHGYGELVARMDRLIVARRRRSESLKLQLEERSPLLLLERGYAIVSDSAGKVLRSADSVAIGQDISVRFARGELDATVRSKRPTKT